MILEKVGANQFSIGPIIIILNNIVVVVHIHVQEMNQLNRVPSYIKEKSENYKF